jgi:hypothetical protein
MKQQNPIDKLSNTDIEQNWELALDSYKTSVFYKEKIVVGVSGHRFDKNIIPLSKHFGNRFLKPNKDNISFLISGGASGWDTEVLKQCFKFGIPYKIYLAFEQDLDKLPVYIRMNALSIKWKKKKYTSPQDKRHYMSRNRDIIKDSDVLHIMLKKQTGGTVYTVQYSKEHKNIPIFNWANMTFINVPKGFTDLTFAGYRKLYFNDILAIINKQMLQQKVFKRS